MPCHSVSGSAWGSSHLAMMLTGRIAPTQGRQYHAVDVNSTSRKLQHEMGPTSNPSMPGTGLFKTLSPLSILHPQDFNDKIISATVSALILLRNAPATVHDLCLIIKEKKLSSAAIDDANDLSIALANYVKRCNEATPARTPVLAQLSSTTDIRWYIHYVGVPVSDISTGAAKLQEILSPHGQPHPMPHSHQQPLHQPPHPAMFPPNPFAAAAAAAAASGAPPFFPPVHMFQYPPQPQVQSFSPSPQSTSSTTVKKASKGTKKASRQTSGSTNSAPNGPQQHPMAAPQYIAFPWLPFSPSGMPMPPGAHPHAAARPGMPPMFPGYVPIAMPHPSHVPPQGYPQPPHASPQLAHTTLPPQPPIPSSSEANNTAKKKRTNSTSPNASPSLVVATPAIDKGKPSAPNKKNTAMVSPQSIQVDYAVVKKESSENNEQLQGEVRLQKKRDTKATSEEEFKSQAILDIEDDDTDAQSVLQHTQHMQSKATEPPIQTPQRHQLPPTAPQSPVDPLQEHPIKLEQDETVQSSQIARSSKDDATIPEHARTTVPTSPSIMPTPAISPVGTPSPVSTQPFPLIPVEQSVNSGNLSSMESAESNVKAVAKDKDDAVVEQGAIKTEESSKDIADSSSDLLGTGTKRKSESDLELALSKPEHLDKKRRTETVAALAEDSVQWMAIAMITDADDIESLADEFLYFDSTDSEAESEDDVFMSDADSSTWSQSEDITESSTALSITCLRNQALTPPPTQSPPSSSTSTPNSSTAVVQSTGASSSSTAATQETSTQSTSQSSSIAHSSGNLKATVFDMSQLVLHPPSVALPQSSAAIFVTSIDNVACFLATIQTPAGSVPVLRRIDNDMVNATLLLMAGGVTNEQERSIILSLQRHKVKNLSKDSLLYGSWLPLSRARELARTTCYTVCGKLDWFLKEELGDWFVGPNVAPGNSSASIKGKEKMNVASLPLKKRRPDLLSPSVVNNSPVPDLLTANSLTESASLSPQETADALLLELLGILPPTHDLASSSVVFPKQSTEGQKGSDKKHKTNADMDVELDVTGEEQENHLELEVVLDGSQYAETANFDLKNLASLFAADSADSGVALLEIGDEGNLLDLGLGLELNLEMNLEPAMTVDEFGGPKISPMDLLATKVALKRRLEEHLSISKATDHIGTRAENAGSILSIPEMSVNMSMLERSIQDGLMNSLSMNSVLDLLTLPNTPLLMGPMDQATADALLAQHSDLLQTTEAENADVNASNNDDTNDSVPKLKIKLPTKEKSSPEATESSADKQEPAATSSNSVKAKTEKSSGGSVKADSKAPKSKTNKKARAGQTASSTGTSTSSGNNSVKSTSKSSAQANSTPSRKTKETSAKPKTKKSKATTSATASSTAGNTLSVATKNGDKAPLKFMVPGNPALMGTIIRTRKSPIEEDEDEEIDVVG